MTPSKTQNQTNNKNKVWTTARVNECMKLIEEGKDIPGGTPFHEGDLSFKAADIVFEYTEDEIAEIARCASDVVYFANNYCMAMTDYGIKKITLRPYQEEVLKAFQHNRFNVFLASRQIGKCLSRQTLVTMSNGTSTQTLPFYVFYYSMIKKSRKLSIHEKIKLLLYNLESKLTHSKIYKLEI